MDFICQNTQSFLFLIKLGVHTIYLKKSEQLFGIIGFSLEQISVSFQRKKKTESFECV